MFYELVARNSRRSRKENGLFFSTLLISIVAFYIVLSLSEQDVMIFLKKMESDAVNRLFTLIPSFYILTLVILFFLIYFASKFQLERRKHEFGVYLMMGMRRNRLFAMLLAEDLRSSEVALMIGLPVAVLLSEIISLVTAKIVGIGIIGHHFSFSLKAVILTSVGFLLIKLVAFTILSGKISRQEIGALLVEIPEGTKKQFPSIIYVMSLLFAVLCLGTAYYMAITGISWARITIMGPTIFLGFVGTLSLFFGLRSVMGVLVKAGEKKCNLHIFNFRQIQENVIHRSSTMAVSSILILAALCCFASGVAMTCFYEKSETHTLDYTFIENELDDCEKDAQMIRETLEKERLDNKFSSLFEMRIGHVYFEDEEDIKNCINLSSLVKSISESEDSKEKKFLIQNLENIDSPHLISLNSYNELMKSIGQPSIHLKKGEAAVYMDKDYSDAKQLSLVNDCLKTNPKIQLNGSDIHLKGKVQTTSVVTDRSITLSFALIVPEETFYKDTKKVYEIYLDGVLKSTKEKDGGLLREISEMNDKLDKTGLEYESYLQNMGRQMFYIVAASYLTIYLAIIFLIVANTIIGVQFLMGQQKTKRRYQTLIRLGASYETLSQSAGKQINWYFGIPVMVAAFNSLFAVRALFSGILSSRVQDNIQQMMFISVAMILFFCVIECIYIHVVKRNSNQYLLTLMEPEKLHTGMRSLGGM